MSDITYPHRVRIWRRTDPGVPVEDTWGRDTLGAPTIVATVGAWIQALSQREATDLTEGGAVKLEYTIFMDIPSVGLAESDALQTIEGGGQPEGEWHRIEAIENPDGQTDHLEIYTCRVKSVEDALVAAQPVSS